MWPALRISLETMDVVASAKDPQALGIGRDKERVAMAESLHAAI